MTTAFCTATISLSALRHNLGIACQYAPASKVIAVIKANAYGHGMAQVAAALDSADAFAVARIEEGIALRALTAKRVLILSGSSGINALAACAEHHLQPVIHTLQDWQLAMQHYPQLCYWIKADTGMHRLGVSAQEWLSISATRHAQCQGLVSHLSDAEMLDNTRTEQQLQQLNALHQHWPQLPRSLANSAAILQHPATHLDWVRPGIMLYGANPVTDNKLPLQPVMSLQSRVIAVRDIATGERTGYNGRWQAQQPSRIATIAAGYADGYPRHAKDGTPVWINGTTYPLAGKVSMDLITVDVSGGDVAVGDTVELWGNHIAANMVAEWADTISYALFTGVTQRVPRIYLQ